MVIWKVPEPLKDITHSYKYSLFYGREGARIVGYDNERPKRDHCHLDGNETAYRFTTVEQLMADFLGEVRKTRLRT